MLLFAHTYSTYPCNMHQVRNKSLSLIWSAYYEWGCKGWLVSSAITLLIIFSIDPSVVWSTKCQKIVEKKVIQDVLKCLVLPTTQIFSLCYHRLLKTLIKKLSLFCQDLIWNRSFWFYYWTEKVIERVLIHAFWTTFLTFYKVNDELFFLGNNLHINQKWK